MSIFQSHEQLIQRTRVPNEVTVLICRLCFTLVTKSKEDIPGALKTHPDSVSPARERPNFELFGQDGRWIQVCVSPEGCIVRVSACRVITLSLILCVDRPCFDQRTSTSVPSIRSHCTITRSRVPFANPPTPPPPDRHTPSPTPPSPLVIFPAPLSSQP